MFTILKMMHQVFMFFWLKGWGILNPNINPMRNAPVYAKYFATIALALFWSLVFCIYTAQFFVIGLNMLAHVAVVSAVFLTWITFRGFSRAYPLGSPGNYPLMRHPNREERCYDLSDAERAALADRADALLQKN